MCENKIHVYVLHCGTIRWRNIFNTKIQYVNCFYHENFPIYSMLYGVYFPSYVYVPLPHLFLLSSVLLSCTCYCILHPISTTFSPLLTSSLPTFSLPSPFLSPSPPFLSPSGVSPGYLWWVSEHGWDVRSREYREPHAPRGERPREPGLCPGW